MSSDRTPSSHGGHSSPWINPHDPRAARTDRLDRRSLALSLAIHVLALVCLIWVMPAVGRESVVYQAIEIRVVSAPPVSAPPPEEEIPPAPQDELVVEPPEERVEEEEAPIPAEEEAPPPEPEETPSPESEDPPPATEDPVPAESEESENDEEVGGEDINVRMEGLRRDHPAYYDNIIRQIARCFRTSAAGNYEAVVQFVIEEDGSVTGISMAQRSGSFVFDLRAQEAIECAGGPGRLGPLPQSYSWDVLPVQFRFRPGSSQQFTRHSAERC